MSQLTGQCLTLQSGQSPDTDNGEACQVVGNFLQVGLITGLNSALIQGVVIVEDKEKQVEQHTSMQQVILKILVHCKC